jgi:hypothetical protein
MTELPPVRFCAYCGEPVTEQYVMPHDQHYEATTIVVDSIMVTNEPCGHALVTTFDKQGDALQRPA